MNWQVPQGSSNQRRAKIPWRCLQSPSSPIPCALHWLCLQVITASHDKTIRLWDLRTGKTLSTLTYHKKAIRALAAHPQE